MATDRSPDYLRGFIVPMQRFTSANHWTAESAVTQGTGRAGIPAAQQSSALVVTSRGTQSKDIDIKTQRAGHVSDNCGFLWKEAADSDYMGGDVPTMIGDFEVTVDNGGTVNIVPRAAVRLADGEIIVASEKTDVSNNYIYITRIGTDGSATNLTINTAVTATLSGESRFPELCLMPDGSVICLYWVADDGEEVAQVEIQRTADKGESWTLVSSRALPEDIDISGTFGAGVAGYQLGRLQCAATSSQVMLLAGVVTHNTTPALGCLVRQYASTSQGLKFKFIEETSSSGSTQFWHPCLVAWNDAYIIAWVKSVDTIAITRMASAFDSVPAHLSVDTADILDPGASIATGGVANRLEDTSMDMWLDQSGRLYLAWVPTSSHDYIAGAYSDLAGVPFEEYGATWKFWGAGNKMMMDLKPPTGASASGVVELVGISGEGDQSIFLNWDPGGANARKTSLFRYRLGGWATVNMPALVVYPEDDDRAYSTLDWIPADLPGQASVWTKTTTGSPAETLDTKLRLAAGTGEDLFYTRTISTKTGGLIVHAKISGISGGNSGLAIGSGVEVQIQEMPSTDTIKIRVLVLSSSIHIYDRHSGSPSTPVASATGLSLTSTDVLIWVDNTVKSVTVHYCEAGSARKYSKLTKASLTTNASTTQELSWGVLTVDPSGSQQSDWHFVSYSEGAAAGRGLSSDPPVARKYPALGYYAALDAGLMISTQDGPAREGDTYQLAVRYDHPVDNALYSVSPSREVAWRSTKITTDPDSNNPAEEKIAWAVDADILGAQVSRMLNDSIGLHLSNVNFRQFSIETYSGGWSTLVTVDNSVDYSGGGSFNFTRTGRTLINTDTPGTWLHLNECSGWRISLDDGAGNLVVRSVATNSEGVLGSTSSKRAVIQLGDAKTTDPTSGTAYLIPDSVTVLMHDMADIAGIRIVIPAQRTREGQFQIGQMVLGPLVIPASQYGRGRTIAWSPDILENEQSNGVLRAQRTGPGGRTVRIAWQDGVDISDLYVSAADPDYWKICTGGLAVAAVGSAPTDMIGLIQHVEGAQEAIVYLPSMTEGSATSQVINRYHDHMLCTVGSDVQIESVVGDELQPTGQGEVFRVGTVVLRETR